MNRPNRAGRRLLVVGWSKCLLDTLTRPLPVHAVGVDTDKSILL